MIQNNIESLHTSQALIIVIISISKKLSISGVHIYDSSRHTYAPFNHEDDKLLSQNQKNSIIAVYLCLDSAFCQVLFEIKPSDP